MNLPETKDWFVGAENYLGCLKSRGLHIEGTIPKSSILFIGINPSFNSKQDRNFGESSYETYPLTEMMNGYFAPAISIKNEVNRILGNKYEFGHHDLFPIRERNQKVIEGLFEETKSGQLQPKKEYSEFTKRWLNWSYEVIKESKPAIIVVINAYASRICFDVDSLKLSNKQSVLDLGADFVLLDGQVTPIMFSGMLSGTRPLDIWSRNRLTWHICHVLKNKDRWPTQDEFKNNRM